MSGYIGSKIAVTQVDGYNRSEADAEFVQVTGDTMTGALGIGGTPSYGLHVQNAVDAQAAGQFERTSGAIMRIQPEGFDAKFGTYSNTPLTFMTNSTARMAIDASGRVTMPYQPVFAATGAGSQTTYSAGDVMFFNTNAGFSSPHYNTSTYRFTAPVAGKYQFNLHLYCYTNYKFQSVLTINGSYPTYSGDVLTMTSNDTGSEGEYAASIIYYLNASDYVDARVRPGSPAVIYMRHSHFSGHLIG